MNQSSAQFSDDVALGAESRTESLARWHAKKRGRATGPPPIADLVMLTKLFVLEVVHVRPAKDAVVCDAEEAVRDLVAAERPSALRHDGEDPRARACLLAQIHRRGCDHVAAKRSALATDVVAMDPTRDLPISNLPEPVFPHVEDVDFGVLRQHLDHACAR